MLIRKTLLFAAGIYLVAGTHRGLAAQDGAVDTTQSVIRLRVLKSGLFSGFGHNHDIEAHIAEGRVQVSGNPAVMIKVHAGDLRVVDREASPKERQDVQQTMQGPKVLDIERFPEISFESTEVRANGERRWIVHGKLTLHGKTSPVEVAVTQENGHYRGSCQVMQRDFGMTPVTVAGGTVKVKDEVKIDFDVVLK